MNILRGLDNWLNDITMYRLVLYGLRTLVGVSLFYAAIGKLPFNVLALVASILILETVAYLTSYVFSRVWKVSASVDSWTITALILFFMLPPVTTVSNAIVAAVAALVAMASKYIVNWNGRHIFNPAAFGAVVVGLLGIGAVTWWVATPILLPVVTLFGLLLLRKLNRFELFTCFALAALVVMVFVGSLDQQHPLDVIKLAFTSWPLVFMGTVMLTEPSTLPPAKNQQLFYAIVVGAVFAAQLDLGVTDTTPQFALIVGNAIAFIFAAKYGLRLRLKNKKQLSPRHYSFVFEADKQFTFKPGQYMEWTLNHPGTDSRGNRRSFSIASAPAGQGVEIGISTSQRISSFKKALIAMQPGDVITAGHLSGEFTLPKDALRKIVLVAGGIGITPFRSMLEHLVATGERRDITIFYFVPSEEELLYKDTLDQARALGISVKPVITAAEPPASWQGLTGQLSQEMLSREVPDYQERLFYISGPKLMLDSIRDTLLASGVASKAVKTDYFSGY